MSRKGFTLLEILLTVSIISLLVTVSYQSFRPDMKTRFLSVVKKICLDLELARSLAVTYDREFSCVFTPAVSSGTELLYPDCGANNYYYLQSSGEIFVDPATGVSQFYNLNSTRGLPVARIGGSSTVEIIFTRLGYPLSSAGCSFEIGTEQISCEISVSRTSGQVSFTVQ